MKAHKLLRLLCIVVGVLAGDYLHAHEAEAHRINLSPQQQAEQLQQDTLPLLGVYRWTFQLGPFEQISTHTFASQYIDYNMRGKVHSTDYRMQKLSYDAEQNKWIGITAEGVVYALFFKDLNADSVTIYKHKCKKGMSEAMALKRPADDTTDDHGWNIYTREGVLEGVDALAFGGTFYDDKHQVFELRNEKATWENITYKNITHHAGERRWVGQHGGRYLVVFYDVEDTKRVKFSVKIVNDIEKAYKLKHSEQVFTTYQMK